jgi:hypothetical protein
MEIIHGESNAGMDATAHGMVALSTCCLAQENNRCLAFLRFFDLAPYLPSGKRCAAGKAKD